MSKENVKKFYQEVAADERLRTLLNELFKPYQGKTFDDAEKADLVEKLVLPLATEKGLAFTMEELQLYEKEMAQQKSTDHELDDNELEAVAGGIGGIAGFCTFIGGGVEIAGLAWCLILGMSL